MFRILLAAATAGMAAAQTFPSPQAVPNVCGTFGDMNACVNDAAQSHQQTIELTGITGGNYMMQQKIYNSSDCETTSLIQTLFAQGTYTNQYATLATTNTAQQHEGARTRLFLKNV